jgi:hypothetical protein
VQGRISLLVKILPAFGALLFVVLHVARAHAADTPVDPSNAGEVIQLPSAPAPVDAPAGRRWYGWQMLLADTGSFAVGLIGATRDPYSQRALGEGLITVGVASFLANGPLIHSANGNAHKVGGSLAMRVPAMAVMAPLLYMAQGARCDLGCGGLVLVLGVPTLATHVLSIVDATALGWSQTQPFEQPKSGHLAATPTLVVTPRGAQLGATGRF